jgi:2-hydroxy-3-keto-5-methylthiopentenyl-1-phosphate phosphatase
LRMQLLGLLPVLLVGACHARNLPPPGPPAKPAVYIDFDGTIAVSEAFENLAATAYLTVSASSGIPPWSHFDDLYMCDYCAAIAHLPEPATLAEELQLQALANLTKAAKDSFGRVKRSGVFNAVSEQALVDEAKTVEIRPGFWEFVAAAEKRGVRVSVLSRNWSVRWIRTVLRESQGAGTLAERLWVYCPEILPDGVLAASPRDRPFDVFSGDNKREVMKKERRGKEEVVFIGDDNSDLAPILQYPTVVGVVAGLDANSAETIRREPGVSLWRAADGFVKRTSVARGAYVLEDFREMITLLEWEEPLANNGTAVSKE